MKKLTLLAFVALLGFGCSVPSAFADAWYKEWSLPANAQIRISANYGNIRIDAGDETQTKASVRTIGWRIDADVQVTASQIDGGLQLEVKRLSSRKFWQVSHAIAIELTVPRGASLDIHTDHGNITTRGVGGSLRADTGDGNIEVVGGNGTVRLHTRDGNINARELDGSISADTGDGNINLEGRMDGMDVRTVDGNLGVTAFAGSSLSSDWSLRTGDGNIILRMQESLGADLDASTGDGRISLDFPVTTIGTSGSETVRGSMSGGGKKLSIRTGDGNINIEKR